MEGFYIETLWVVSLVASLKTEGILKLKLYE